MFKTFSNPKKDLKLLGGLILSAIAFVSVAVAATSKQESGSPSAQSVVIYGNYAGTLVAFNVASDGTLQLH